jgi:hypothetical protein
MLWWLDGDRNVSALNERRDNRRVLHPASFFPLCSPVEKKRVVIGRDGTVSESRNYDSNLALLDTLRPFEELGE